MLPVEPTQPTKNHPIHVMLDLETLDTTPNAGIIAVAAVPFMWGEPLEPFYQKCSVLDVERRGFDVSRSTMNWWGLQDTAIREETFSGTQLCVELLSHLHTYMEKLPGTSLVWGNGAAFDNVVLRNAYDHFTLPTPWNFRNDRCYRTLLSLFPEIKDRVVPNTHKHNALWDARYQAEVATFIFAHMERMKELSIS